MINLVSAEIRKILKTNIVLVLWIFLLLFGFILIRKFDIFDTYADIFYKIEGSIPLMGLIMFIVTAGNYTKEYDSNMTGLINTTKNGKKLVIISKSIANGLVLSVINMSFALVVGIKGFSFFNFEKLDESIRSLWYFGNSNVNLTILQMYLIMIVSIVIGSFVFAQIGLVLSSASKSAVIPFVLGGLTMAIPYFISNFVPKDTMKFIALTPNWVMMSQQIVKYNIPNIFILLSIFISIILIITLPMITYKNFTSDKRF